MVSNYGLRLQPGGSIAFKLAIALANKIARIAWGVLHGGRNFEVRPMNQAA